MLMKSLFECFWNQHEKEALVKAFGFDYSELLETVKRMDGAE
jgi:hypothetical protein